MKHIVFKSEIECKPFPAGVGLYDNVIDTFNVYLTPSGQHEKQSCSSWAFSFFYKEFK